MPRNRPTIIPAPLVWALLALLGPGVLIPATGRGEDEPLPIITSSDRCFDPLLDLPVAEVAAPLGEPISPWNVTQVYNTHDNFANLGGGHNGLDVASGKTDTKVQAVLAGKVIASEDAGGWGHAVVVASRVHPQSSALITTHYHHFEQRHVAHCATVEAGQILGQEGMTGFATGEHLHLTVRYWASPEHLENWLQADTAMLHGNDGYLSPDGQEFHGAFEPGTGVDFDSPYEHYGHLDPLAFVKDYFTDYLKDYDGDPDTDDGAPDATLPYAWSLEYVKKMRYLGIEMGDWDGDFGAQVPVRRREAARWLRLAVGEDLMVDASLLPVFTDVPYGDPDHAYVQALTRYPQPISVINPDHTCAPGEAHFCPDSEVDRAAALKMTVLAFHANEFNAFYNSAFWLLAPGDVAQHVAELVGLPPDELFVDVPIDAWYAPYVYFGALHGFVKAQLKFNPGAKVLRAEMAKWVVMGHEKLHGNGAEDPCTAVACPAGDFCDPASASCMDAAVCVPAEDHPCELGGGIEPDGAGCGDGSCVAGEDCEACPADCGECPPGCPDGQCDGETCETCPQDCGPCQSECGDDQCDVGEDCGACPQDCGECPAGCPDGSCDGGEDCGSCPQDCGQCPSECDDGQCDADEDCDSCPQDCGQCPSECDDGQCDADESCDSCPQDCGQCPCQESDYWSPDSASDVDPVGDQSNATIDQAIEIEVRGDGEGLEVRACKSGGVFSNDVAFSIRDGASSNGYLEVADLATAGESCSAWVGLLGDTGYLEGEQFGGIWQLISPASSAADWDWPQSDCSVGGDPTGTCWNGVDITLTRTCK